MAYQISYDANTRLIAFNGLTSVTQGDIRSNDVTLSKTDPDGLLADSDIYIVFDNGTRVRFIDGHAVFPDFGDRHKVFLQLCIEKDNMRFYSLNTLMLKVKRAII